MLIILVVVAMLATASDVPPLWSGSAGFEEAAPPVLLKSGDVHPGDVLAKTSSRPTRTARLTQDYQFRAGEEEVLIPKGTPFFAYFYPVIQSVDAAPLPPRRDNDLVWCVAAVAPPYGCFRWNAPGQTEYSPATDDATRFRTPFIQGWRAAPEPALHEEPVAIEASQEVMVVKSIDERGVTVSKVQSQGGLSKGWDRHYSWGQGPWTYDVGTLNFAPVKGRKDLANGTLVTR